LLEKLKQEYETKGYFLYERAIDQDGVASLIHVLSAIEKEANNYGFRDLIGRLPAIRQLALSPPLLSIAKEVLGDFARPVRSVFFDKVKGANWGVPWHQDTSIAVKKHIDVAGFGPWSEKQGVIHVEPPETYLKNTLTLRIHLDKTDRENGVLRVIPGTHIDGRVKSKQLINIVEKSQDRVVECNAGPGDVLLMCPLLFHSSRKALNPSHRRIVHIEYSSMTLPDPLEWYESAG